MRYLLLTASLLSYLHFEAHAQTPVWTNAVQPTNPTPTDDTNATGGSITVDAAGNQYVAGRLLSGQGSGVPATRVFGSTSLSSGGGRSGGFVARLSPTQQWQWAVRATQTGGEEASFGRVTVSPAGDAYATGYVETDPQINPNGGAVVTVGAYTYTTTHPTASFITRLNGSGQPQWLAGASGVGIYATGWDAAAGNLLVAGEYLGAASVGNTTLPAAPAGGMFVARLSAAGQWLSATGYPLSNLGSNPDFDFFGVDIGPQGQLGFNFRFRGGTFTLGSNVLSNNATTSAGEIEVVAQLSPAGQWQWATQTTNGIYSTYNLSYDRTGNLWLLGEADGTVQLGSVSLANNSRFVARLSAAGQWNTVGIMPPTSSGGSAVEAYSMAIDAQGNAVVAGSLYNTTTFGAITLTPASGGTNNFVARYGANGQWQYARLAPTATSGSYYLDAIALDAAGSLFATGAYYGSVTFGSTTLNYTTSAQSSENVYVAKLTNAGALAVRQAAGAAPLALWPNPAAAGTAATLRLPAPATSALPVMLRNTLGQIVRTATLPAGRQELALPTADLTPGLYLLEAGTSRAQLLID